MGIVKEKHRQIDEPDTLVLCMVLFWPFVLAYSNFGPIYMRWTGRASKDLFSRRSRLLTENQQCYELQACNVTSTCVVLPASVVKGGIGYGMNLMLALSKCSICTHKKKMVRKCRRQYLTYAHANLPSLSETIHRCVVVEQNKESRTVVP